MVLSEDAAGSHAQARVPVPHQPVLAKGGVPASQTVENADGSGWQDNWIDFDP
jgi:hypothetical protein